MPVAESLGLYMQSNIGKNPFNQILISIDLVSGETANLRLNYALYSISMGENGFVRVKYLYLQVTTIL
jgi:hypothetical protein